MNHIMAQFNANIDERFEKVFDSVWMKFKAELDNMLQGHEKFEKS